MMFADDRSIDNLQQLFIEFKKYLNLQKEYTKLEITEKLSILLSALILLSVVIILGMVALFYLSFALAYIFRSTRRRTHGKLQHHRLFPSSTGFISNYLPQKTHHQPDGEFYCRIVF